MRSTSAICADDVVVDGAVVVQYCGRLIAALPLSNLYVISRLISLIWFRAAAESFCNLSGTASAPFVETIAVMRSLTRASWSVAEWRRPTSERYWDDEPPLAPLRTALKHSR